MNDRKAHNSLLLDNNTAQGPYSHCSQILSQGIFDDVSFDENIDYQAFAVKNACQEMSSWDQSANENWDRDCGGSSSGGGFNANFVVDAVPIGLGANGNSSKNYCKDKGARAAYRKSWYKHMCKSSHSDTSLKKHTNRILRQANDSIVSAWASCAKTRNFGLTCYAAKGIDTDSVTFNAIYDPAPTASSQVDLSWDFVNVNANRILPESMGHGDISQIFNIEEVSKGISFALIAKGQGETAGQESCSIDLDPIEKKGCDGSNLVGSISRKVYVKNSPVCIKLDRCEQKRLKFLANGGYYRYYGDEAYNVYLDLVADNWVPIDNGPDKRFGFGPCLD